MRPLRLGRTSPARTFFTSSTSFANPAVTLARTLSDTFAGIAPASVLGFVIAQALGAVLAYGVIRLLWPGIETVSGDVVVPREDTEVERRSTLTWRTAVKRHVALS
jgi:arsenate reductase